MKLSGVVLRPPEQDIGNIIHKVAVDSKLPKMFQSEVSLERHLPAPENNLLQILSIKIRSIQNDICAGSLPKTMTNINKHTESFLRSTRTNCSLLLNLIKKFLIHVYTHTHLICVYKCFKNEIHCV